MKNAKKIIFSLIMMVGTSVTLGATAFADQVYVVQSGDTLSSIAQEKTGTVDFIDTIAQANEIMDINFIYVGQELKIPENIDGKVAEVVAKETSSEDSTPSSLSGKQLTVETTAYDGYGMGGVTATGNLITSPSDKVVAVDPSVIPLGSRIYVPGYGEAIAWDTGGVIKGNIVDLNMSTADAIQWGRRTVTITILD